MTNTPKDAAEIATRLHRLTGLTQNQIDSLSLSLNPIQVDQINDSDLASLANGTLPGLPLNASGGLPLGLPGATLAARFVGGTASGAPTTGTFAVRDWVVTGTGTFYVCTVAGSPGTWVQVSGGGGGSLPSQTGNSGKVLGTDGTNASWVVGSGAVASVAGKTGTVTLVKADVGLGSVDNTSDAAKQTSNDARYVRTVNSTGPDGTGNVVVAGGGTVSDATTSAKGIVQLAGDLGGTAASPTVPGLAAKVNAAGAAAAAPVQSVASRTGAVTLAKADVGLGNVDNTADASKPVSTAQQSALDLKAPLASPAFTGTPTGITKAHVGLGNVDNTADASKPVSTAQAAAIAALQTTPTAVKTGAYTAIAGDFVPVDTTSAAVPITLPAAPADKSVIGVKLVTQGGTNAVTIARAGSDVFNKAGGSTSLTLSTVNQTMMLQYQASSSIWYVRDSLSLAALDSRFAAAGAGGGTYPSGPLVKKGVYIPSNWGSTWRTARAAHASALAEVVIFGDSTTYGSSTTAGSEVFSWVSWLRRLSIAAGYTDGGRGIVYNDNPDTVVDQALPTTDSAKAVTSAPTGFGASNVGPTPAGSSSTTAGDTITFTGKGTALRLHYASNATTGQFTYSVDGGGAVTVTPYVSGGSGSGGYGTAYVSGLTEGTHTVAITNVGSIPVQPPTTSFPNRTGVGGQSLPAGTYYYVVTGTNASGETLQSIVITGTCGSNSSITLTMNTLPAALTGIKVYRTANGAGSSSGPFGFLGTSATVNFTDTGGTSPNMAVNPPVTNTAGNDTSVKNVGVNPEFFRAAGIVYHKQATSGISSGTYFGTSVTVFNAAPQVSLGLSPMVTTNQYDWLNSTKASGPTARTPVLAAFVLGINDLQGLTIAAEGTPTTTESDTASRQVALVENYIGHFVRLARAAGADPLVVVPHFDMAAHGHTWGGQFTRAVWSAGVAHGCAVVDFNEAIRPVNTMAARGLGSPGVHAEANAYKAEAQFLWDNCLSL